MARLSWADNSLAAQIEALLSAAVAQKGFAAAAPLQLYQIAWLPWPAQLLTRLKIFGLGLDLYTSELAAIVALNIAEGPDAARQMSEWAEGQQLLDAAQQPEKRRGWLSGCWRMAVSYQTVFVLHPSYLGV